jgi:predicted homoserine dehydrogenase-like protein
VVTVAKRDLKAGERLDGVGGFGTYGLVDNVVAARKVAALPMGLSENCRLLRDISKDDVISVNDVESPPGGLAEALWLEQSALWPLSELASQTQPVQR